LMMDDAKRAAIEAAGWTVGDAGDFLEMPDEERKVVELRVQVGLAVRRRRRVAGLTQLHLASKLGSSQSRVYRVELGLPGVGLDLAFRALFAVGGGLRDLAGIPGLPNLADLPAEDTHPPVARRAPAPTPKVSPTRQTLKGQRKAEKAARRPGAATGHAKKPEKKPSAKSLIARKRRVPHG